MYNNFLKIKKMKFLKKIATDTEAVQKEHRVVYYNNSNQKICYTEPFKWVDLGLSVKWANMNLGAVTESDYGDYYMWGSTTSNTDNRCDWSTHPFNDGTNQFNSDYFNKNKSNWVNEDTNGIITLKPAYDAAYQTTDDGTVHMPTYEQFIELNTNTTKRYIYNYNGTGVSGVRYTSNKEGYQNNSIFIPNSGYRSYETFSDQGKYGYLWCTRLNEAYIHAGQIYYFESMSSPSMKYRFMDTGLAIRPVLTPQS